jgi:hypothetical protein
MTGMDCKQQTPFRGKDPSDKSQLAGASISPIEQSAALINAKLCISSPLLEVGG